MKKFWKTALRLATLATVIPVNVTHDEATGKTTYQSLLVSLDVTTQPDGSRTDIGLNLGEGILTGAIRSIAAARKESAMFADGDLVPSPAEDTPAAPAPEEAPAYEGLFDADSQTETSAF